MPQPFPATQPFPTHPPLPCAATRLRLRASLLAALVLGVTGCTQFPELDARLTEADLQAQPPALIPAERILAGTDTQAIGPDTQSALDDRVAALQNRAEALRGTALEPETRARMQAGVTLPPS